MRKRLVDTTIKGLLHKGLTRAQVISKLSALLSVNKDNAEQLLDEYYKRN